MQEIGLSPTGYVVLGLLEVYGAGTPYDLKRWVDTSIGYFWSVPRAQLYVEPARLVEKGLAAETRENAGRHRRLYRITEAGRRALRDWLREGTPGPSELRDPGLLKLYFSTISSREDVVALARKEAELHISRLADYDRIQPLVERIPRSAFALATLRLGQMHERSAIEFWEGVVKDPPSIADDGANGEGEPRADGTSPSQVPGGRS